MKVAPPNNFKSHLPQFLLSQSLLSNGETMNSSHVVGRSHLAPKFYPTDLVGAFIGQSKGIFAVIIGVPVALFATAKTHLADFFNPQVRWLEKFMSNLNK